MRQRVMIAMALSCSPRLLIADEATTALDVTTQAQIMRLLAGLQAQLGMAILMISHDLGLAASFADEVVVMYAGRAVERAPVRSLFGNVRMPYTSALLGAVPRLDRAAHTPLPVIGGRPVLSAPPGRRRRPAARSRRAARGRTSGASGSGRSWPRTSRGTRTRAGIRWRGPRRRLPCRRVRAYGVRADGFGLGAGGAAADSVEG